MEQNSGKNSGIKNLKPFKKGQSGNPNGRPKGQRDYKTIYKEALIKIGEANNKTPEEIEELMEQAGMKKALKGDFQFWKDIRDRVHGKAKEHIDHTTGGEKMAPLMVKFMDDGKSDSNGDTQ